LHELTRKFIHSELKQTENKQYNVHCRQVLVLSILLHSTLLHSTLLHSTLLHGASLHSN